MALTYMWEQGLESGRPPTGQPSRLYFATDTGRVFVDTGSVWQTTALVHRGTYGAVVAYQDKDLVTYAGSVWRALRASTGVAPVEGADWTLFLLGGGVPTTRTLATTAPLTGGGDLSADRTLAISPATTSVAGSMSAADKAKLNNVSASVYKPSGYLAETVPRANISAVATTAWASGTLYLAAIYLTAGTVVSNITFYAGGTAMVTPSNQWFSLWDANRNFLRATGDDLANPWSVSTMKTLTLTSSYTVAADGLFFLGIVIVASTLPNMRGLIGDNFLLGQLPRLCGTSNTGLTTPATAPATANLQVTTALWAWGLVS